MRPGVNVTTREIAPGSVVPTDVATGFMVGITESGPTIPDATNLVRNLDEYDTVYAPSKRDDTQGAVMRDTAEEFFREGGSRLYVGRLLGSGAATASGTIMDAAGTPAVFLNVTAKGPGEWGNDLSVVVQLHSDNIDITDGSYRLQVVRNDGDPDEVLLEETPDLIGQQAAIDWSLSSGYVRFTGGVSALTIPDGSQTEDLAGGLRDTGTISNTTWKNAALNFSLALGPGILMAPGATTDQIHCDMASAANSTGRVAFLDGANTATAATLVAAAKAVIDSNTLKRARFAALFAPWHVVPGLTSGSVRIVPPCGAIAGLFAHNVALGKTANEPAAGPNGVFASVQGFSQTYSDADRKLLNDNGVCVARDVYGTNKVYGWRTTADPVNDKRWINLGNSLLHRQIVALCNSVGERFIFRQIDGQGHLIGEFNGALVGEVCMPLYLAGALTGQTAVDAYKVDTSASVNTPATIEAQEIHAILSVVMSPFSEEVDIEIVKYLVTETIPA